MEKNYRGIKASCSKKKRGCSFDPDGQPFGIIENTPKNVHIERTRSIREAA